MTEAELQSAVLDLAALFGWKVAHFRPARTAHGWRTPVSADGAGWPDLVLVHPDRGLVLFRELKADRGRLTLEQQAWQQWLTAAGQDFAVWRPEDLDEIAETLSNGRVARGRGCAISTVSPTLLDPCCQFSRAARTSCTGGLMPRKAEPVARLGWRLTGEWLPIGAMGPNREAAESTVGRVRELGRLEVVDEAVVTAFVMLAEAVDADPTNAALWGQYRAAEVALRGLGVSGDDDAFARFIAGLAGVGDSPVSEPADARRVRRKDGGGVAAAVHAVAGTRGRRGRGAAS